MMRYSMGELVPEKEVCICDHKSHTIILSGGMIARELIEEMVLLANRGYEQGVKAEEDPKSCDNCRWENESVDDDTSPCYTCHNLNAWEPKQ